MAAPFIYFSLLYALHGGFIDYLHYLPAFHTTRTFRTLNALLYVCFCPLDAIQFKECREFSTTERNLT